MISDRVCVASVRLLVESVVDIDGIVGVRVVSIVASVGNSVSCFNVSVIVTMVG